MRTWWVYEVHKGWRIRRLPWEHVRAITVRMAGPVAVEPLEGKEMELSGVERLSIPELEALRSVLIADPERS